MNNQAPHGKRIFTMHNQAPHGKRLEPAAEKRGCSKASRSHQVVIFGSDGRRFPALRLEPGGGIPYTVLTGAGEH
jgi:hypothetical protein